MRVTAKQHGEGGFKLDKNMGPGEIFGLIGLMDHKKRSATCTATGPATVAKLPWSAFDMLCTSHARLAFHFQHYIAGQLARDARKLNELIRKAIRDVSEGNIKKKISKAASE